MVADLKTLIKNYTADVKTILPVDRVFLFGSYAKGVADECSDIDICFFLKTFDGRRRVDILKELLGAMRKYKGVYFEPTVFPTSEIQNDNPFVKEIMQTGIELQL